jgi:hypothetical protein
VVGIGLQGVGLGAGEVAWWLVSRHRVGCWRAGAFGVVAAARPAWAGALARRCAVCAGRAGRCGAGARLLGWRGEPEREARGKEREEVGEKKQWRRRLAGRRPSRTRVRRGRGSWALWAKSD